MHGHALPTFPTQLTWSTSCLQNPSPRLPLSDAGRLVPVYKHFTCRRTRNLVENLSPIRLHPLHAPLPCHGGTASICTKNNVFTCTFNRQTFSHSHGIAMGTKVTPALATRFLSHLEDDFLALSPHKPELWLHYIDAILCVWNHGPAAFDSFLSALNNLKTRIKFSAKVSSFGTTCLLDTQISYNSTNKFSYVHGSFYHPILDIRSRALP